MHHGAYRPAAPLYSGLEKMTNKGRRVVYLTGQATFQTVPRDARPGDVGPNIARESNPSAAVDEQSSEESSEIPGGLAERIT